MPIDQIDSSTSSQSNHVAEVVTEKNSTVKHVNIDKKEVSKVLNDDILKHAVLKVSRIRTDHIGYVQRLSAEQYPLERASATSVQINDTIPDLKKYLELQKTYFIENLGTNYQRRLTLGDFIILGVIGTGGSGTVYLVQFKSNNRYYALKSIHKGMIVRRNQMRYIKLELRISKSIRFPFNASLLSYFLDNSYIYIVMPYYWGGDFFSLLEKYKKLDENTARFYSAQIILGIEYLHYLDLIHRDLKPENFVLDGYGYIKIIDYGYCKVVAGRTYTFCGTGPYISPECINHKGYGKSADIWAYGVCLYEMCSHNLPFNSNDELELFKKIVKGAYEMKKYFSSNLKDLIKKILVKDPTKRLGNLKNGIQDIKKHAWFKHTDWLGLLNYRVEPPHVPVRPQFTLADSELTPRDFGIRISADRYEEYFRDF